MTRSKKADDEEAADEKGAAQQMDREGVEKQLVHLGQKLQGGGGGGGDQPTLDVMQFLAAMRHEMVSSCQLADHELRGFIAEAPLDEQGGVNYVEHVKTWVPIIFELRKSRVYEAILAKEWGGLGNQLVDLSEFEEAFPIPPTPRKPAVAETEKGSGSARKSSKERTSKDRGSGEQRGSSKGSITRASTRFLASVMRKDSKEPRGSISKRTRTSMDLGQVASGIMGSGEREDGSPEARRSSKGEVLSQQGRNRSKERSQTLAGLPES